MPQRQLGLLSFGVLVVIIAILLLLQLGWDTIFSLTLTFFGLWVILLAGLRAKNPVKYERSAFSTLIWGIMLLVIGGAWLLNIQTGYWLYSAVLLLVIVGILAVASALSSMRKKP